ncbi:MAG: CBS domain-containing protein [Haloplanus sp.]
MLVRDVMVTDVVTCGPDTSLRTAGRRMLDADVGSVVVVDDGVPVGIVTETDALRAGVLTDRPFDGVAIREVASGPLVTVAPETTVRKAVDRMKDEGVKRLPVVDDGDLVGIVTRTDVAAHYGAFVREAHALDARREDWESR